MTYKQIQELYKQRYNSTIQPCWIADVKRNLGLTTRKAYNRISPDSVAKPCPPDERWQRIETILVEL